MFKMETKKPQIITTSLFDPALTIDMNTFDQPHQRIMLDTGNGLLQGIEPAMTNSNTYEYRSE